MAFWQSLSQLWQKRGSSELRLERPRNGGQQVQLSEMGVKQLGKHKSQGKATHWTPELQPSPLCGCQAGPATSSAGPSAKWKCEAFVWGEKEVLRISRQWQQGIKTSTSSFKCGALCDYTSVHLWSQPCCRVLLHRREVGAFFLKNWIGRGNDPHMLSCRNSSIKQLNFHQIISVGI